MKTEIIRVDKDRCISCDICFNVCICDVFKKDDDIIKVTKPSLCILCGHCKAVCPENAISFPSLNPDEFEPAPSKDALPSSKELMLFFRSRRSIRIFKNKGVEKEKIEKIIQAGRFAPSGGNRQPVEYVVAHTPEVLNKVLSITVKKLADMAVDVNNETKEMKKNNKKLSARQKRMQFYSKRWLQIEQLHKKGIDMLFYHAPILIVTHVSPAMSTLPGVDAGIAGTHMVLMAQALGLGTCFCGFVVLAIEASLELRSILKIPKEHSIPLSFMVGYPDIHFKRLVSRRPARVVWL